MKRIPTLYLFLIAIPLIMAILYVGVRSDRVRLAISRIYDVSFDSTTQNVVDGQSNVSEVEIEDPTQHKLIVSHDDGHVSAESTMPQSTPRLDPETVESSFSPITKEQAAWGYRKCVGVQPGLDLSDFNGRITFDDGPHPDTTPCLVQMLTEAKVRDAVFFFLGYRILEYPRLASLVVNAGYEVGYHSMFHQNLAELSTEQIRKDITRFRKVLNRALGRSYDLKIGRPPFGGMTTATVKVFRGLENDGTLLKTPVDRDLVQELVDPGIISAFEAEQLQLLLWNVDFDDWKSVVDTQIAVDTYSPRAPQVWLLHENPIDWVTLRRFDNDLVAIFPVLLKTFDVLQQSAPSGRNSIASVQALLGRLGYEPGPIDGLQGANTRAAIRAFQRTEGLPENDYIDEGLLHALRSAVNEKE